MQFAPSRFRKFLLNLRYALGGRMDYWEIVHMVRTIVLGNYSSVQGQFVRELKDGRIVVSIGEQEFAGRPVKTAA